MNLSQRVQAIKPSPTLAVSQKAAELRASGKDVIGLGTGEPDFDTPEHIKLAAIDAINQGFTKYTAVDGIPELKQAIIAKLTRDNQLNYQANQILVSNGGKQSFYNLAQALLNPGDEVIIPAPYWVSYPDMVILAGAKPVILDSNLEQNYKITATQLSSAITDKTRLFVINSPSNPSGMAYSREELQAIGDVLEQHPNIMIATDDMYEHILWQDAFVNILNTNPALYDRTMVLNGVSKAYAMTGWRIGYAAGPAALIAAMKKIQSQSTSNPCSISQKAATAAINGPQLPVADMVKAFKQRHDKVYTRLNAMELVSVKPADGTFYIFANIQAAIDKKGLKDDVDFAEKLLSEQGVALVPGTAFGCPGAIRLSFATNQKILDEALNRLEKFIDA